MILEVATLNIVSGEEEGFENAFSEAQLIIRQMNGYIKHELHKCIEKESNYLLLVWWETIADHETGFRQSSQYQEWKKLLHHFYDPFPTVLHFSEVSL